MAIYKEFWTCPHCSGRNDGPEINCSSCGKSRDANVKFQLDDNAPEVTSPEEIAEAKAGANKICDHCKGVYQAFLDSCPHCASRSAEKSLPVTDYNPEQEIDEGSRVLRSRRGVYAPSQDKIRLTTSVDRTGGFWAILAIPIGLIITLGYLFSPKSEVRQVKVLEFSWTRTVRIEKLQTFTESDWDVPAGGVVIDKNRKIRDYRDVVLGYDYKWETYEYQDGMKEVVCGKRSLGNGYAEDKMCQVPNMKTRRRRIKTAIMGHEPVYDIWYTFQIDRWVHSRDVKAEAKDHSPYWLPLELGKKEREGSKHERYAILFGDDTGKSYKLDYPQSEWQKFSRDMGYSAKFNWFGIMGKVSAPEAE